MLDMNTCGYPDHGSHLPPLSIFLSVFFVLTTGLWPPSAHTAHSADCQTFLLYHWTLHLSSWALHPDSEPPQRDYWTFPLILPAFSAGLCLCPLVGPQRFTLDSLQPLFFLPVLTLPFTTPSLRKTPVLKWLFNTNRRVFLLSLPFPSVFSDMKCHYPFTETIEHPFLSCFFFSFY